MALLIDLNVVQLICLIPTIGGSIYVLLSLLTVLRFRSYARHPSTYSFAVWPPVTVLKPVCNLEKNLRANLRSICLQDYPNYQVVFSTTSSDDPAIPLLREIEQEFGHERVSVVVKNTEAGTNRKVNNLLGGLTAAKHEILVMSDSDMLLEPGYLKATVEPLADPEVGCVNMLFKATRADRWYEKMEQLNMNVDFMPSVVFAYVTGSSKFCLGPSIALRRSMLEKIGGLESLATYLVEDYEIGRRILESGKKVAVVPFFLEQVVSLTSVADWWIHQLRWDQSNRAARPVGFLATVLVRSVPFALLFAILRLGDGIGLEILSGAIGLRLATAAGILRWGLRDPDGLKSLALLPLRDLVGFLTWFLTFTKRTVAWRGHKYTLRYNGQLAASLARKAQL